MSEPITVITPTSGRPGLLARAIRSVRAQDYPGPIEHLVVADDCPDAVAGLGDGIEGPPRRALRVHVESRPAHERGPGAAERASVYPRLARLLNIGVGLASSPWIAFLDDDNEHKPDHLSSLRAFAAEHGLDAAHSAREMVWPDGSPYLERFFPGASSAREGRRIHDLMCRRGVWVEGTNVLKDRADPAQDGFHNSTVLSDTDPIFLVDQNLWLVARDVLVRHPIPEDFSADEIRDNTCPDDKMLETLIRNRIRFESTERPSVRYYLGGISNGDERTWA